MEKVHEYMVYFTVIIGFIGSIIRCRKWGLSLIRKYKPAKISFLSIWLWIGIFIFVVFAIFFVGCLLFIIIKIPLLAISGQFGVDQLAILYHFIVPCLIYAGIYAVIYYSIHNHVKYEIGTLFAWGILLSLMGVFFLSLNILGSFFIGTIPFFSNLTLVSGLLYATIWCLGILLPVTICSFQKE